MASAELQKRNSTHNKQLKVRAKKLAEFISTAEAEEVKLGQRLRDAQGKEVFQIIERIAPKSSLEPLTSQPTDDGANHNDSESSSTSENILAQPQMKLQLFKAY